MILLGAAVACGRPTPVWEFHLPAPLVDLETRALTDPNDAHAHFDLALAYWNEKRWAAAERAFREAATIDPRLAEAYLGLGLLPFARRPELVKEMREERVPEEWRPVLEDARRSYRRAFLIDPLVDLRAVGDVASSDSETGGELGVLADSAYEDAHERLHGVIIFQRTFRHREPPPPPLLWLHGLAAAHVGEYREAIVDFEQLLELTLEEEREGPARHLPMRSNDYRYVLALLNHRAGRSQKAIRLYREALSYDIGLYVAHARIADIYEESRMWKLAILERRRAIETMPDDPSLLYDLGVTLHRAGSREEAEVELARALDANPRDARAAYRLGIVRVELGRFAEAYAAFERFLEIAPSRMETEIADAKNWLVELR